MYWHLSNRADQAALPLADEHYSRRKIGSPQFVPPGRCLVLLAADGQALWTTSYPYAAFVKHAWAGAWMCSLFRRRAACRHVASELIRQAVAATRWKFGEPPPQGMVTFVDPSQVPGMRRRTKQGTVMVWGYSFMRAGFEQVGETRGGLIALRLRPENVPASNPPNGAQGSLGLD